MYAPSTVQEPQPDWTTEIHAAHCCSAYAKSPLPYTASEYLNKTLRISIVPPTTYDLRYEHTTQQQYRTQAIGHRQCSAMEYLGPGNEGLSPRAAAGILVERLKNAGDMGDRRDALDALLKLSQEHPTEVGEAGMPIFTDVLQAGVADRAMTQTIMEIMLNLVAEREGPGTGANVSSFLKDVQNVQNLLDLLESPDTMAALSALQVCTLALTTTYPTDCCCIYTPGNVRTTNLARWQGMTGTDVA